MKTWLSPDFGTNKRANFLTMPIEKAYIRVATVSNNADWRATDWQAISHVTWDHETIGHKLVLVTKSLPGTSFSSDSRAGGDRRIDSIGACAVQEAHRTTHIRTRIYKDGSSRCLSRSDTLDRHAARQGPPDLR